MGNGGTTLNRTTDRSIGNTPMPGLSIELVIGNELE